MSPRRQDDGLGDLEAQLAELALVLEDAEDAIAEAARREAGQDPGAATDGVDVELGELDADGGADGDGGELGPPLDERIGGFAAPDEPEPAREPGPGAAPDPEGRAAEPATPEPAGAAQVAARYGTVVAALEAVAAGLRGGRAPPLQPLHRAAGALLALASRAAPATLALTVAGPWRGAVEGQLAQVGVLTAMMAARLGLRGAALRETCVAASLAGAGRALRPETATSGPARCAEEGLYLEGVRRLLPVSGAGRAAALRIVLASELCRAESRSDGHPLTQLVATAEAYEHRTRPRALGGGGLSPDRAVDELRGDDALSRRARLALLATVGIYPVGTTVRLSSDETAVVVGPPRRTDRLGAPPVMVVADALGHPGDGRVVDLSEGEGEVAITRVVERTEADLGVGQFMFT